MLWASLVVCSCLCYIYSRFPMYPFTNLSVLLVDELFQVRGCLLLFSDFQALTMSKYSNVGGMDKLVARAFRHSTRTLWDCNLLGRKYPWRRFPGSGILFQQPPSLWLPHSSLPAWWAMGVWCPVIYGSCMCINLLKSRPHMSETRVTYGLWKQCSVSNLLSSKAGERVQGECGVPLPRLFRLLRTLQLKTKYHVAMERAHSSLGTHFLSSFHYTFFLLI